MSSRKLGLTVSRWVLSLERRDMKIILHLVKRINSGLHTSNLILLWLSYRRYLGSKNPHKFKSGGGESVVMSWCLLVSLIS